MTQSFTMILLAYLCVSAVFGQMSEGLFRRNSMEAETKALNVPQLPQLPELPPVPVVCASDEVGFSVWGLDVRMACRDLAGTVRQQKIAFFGNHSIVDMVRLAEGEYWFLDQRGALIRGKFEGGGGTYYRWPVASAVSMGQAGWNSATVFGYEGALQYWHWYGVLSMQVTAPPVYRTDCHYFIRNVRGDDFCTDIGQGVVFRVPARFFQEKFPSQPETFFQARGVTRIATDENKLWLLVAPRYDYKDGQALLLEAGKLIRIRVNSDGSAGAPDTVLVGVDTDFSTTSGLIVRGGKVYFIANLRGPKGEVVGKQIMLFDEKAGKLSVFLSVQEIGGDYPFIAALKFLD